MIILGRNLRDLYEAFILPMGHPDPIGYVTRAIMESGGETDYYDGRGRMGFMPVDPALAMEMTGVQDVVNLQSNVMTTVLIDQMFFRKYGDINDMIVAFHFGESALSDVGYTPEQRDFLNEVDEFRPQIQEIVSPRRATLEDVVKMIRDEYEGKNKPKKIVSDLVNKLLGER